MDFSSSSHAPITTPQGGYDVFISFRGEDTRNNFTSHLYTALREKQIETFIDTENIRAGDEISGKLLNAIEGSKLYLVIFSPNYAFSKWCLLELEKILVCKKMKCKTVVPVFYKVDPSDVRHQKKNFEDAFRKHEGREKMDKVQRWRDDLKEAASLSGWAFSNTGTEADLVKNIVDSILKNLNKLSSTYSEGLVGIDAHIEELKSLLCMESQSSNVCSVGIWGMGGIGKTTVARAFFDSFWSSFNGFCFFENVREQIERHGVDAFQIKLLKEILDEKEVMKGNQSLRLTFTRDRLRRKKVLIVLDDVDNSVLLKVPEFKIHHDLFGPESKVVITSRNKQVLKYVSVDEVYTLKGLDHDKASQLFSLNAFKDKRPTIDYMELMERVVRYAEGNPLALKVFGSHLLGRERKYWEDALDKIEKFPKKDIETILRVSYDGLSTNEQNIFLDIACFLKGENKDCVIEILKTFGDVMYCSVDNLIDKCLVTISNNNTLEMHHLLQEMGQAIAGEEAINSRLYDPKKICDVLMNKEGAEAIQSIDLNLSKVPKLDLPYDAFVRMSNLRLLRIIGWNSQVHTFDHGIQHLFNKMPYFFRRAFQCFGWDPQMQLSGHDFQLLSKELRYLHWEAFPFKFFPSISYAENLVSLSFSNGNFKQLWRGTQHLVNLRWVNLRACKYLTEIPDLSNAKKIEEINLRECESLVTLHSSVQHLTNLQSLDLSWCGSLRYLPSRLDSMSLQRFDAFLSLNVEDCPYIVSPVLEHFCLYSPGIKEFPLFLHHYKSLSITMKEILLSGTSIEEVPSSIQSLTMLHSLDLSCNQNLSRLPSAIWKLKSLLDLDLNNCPKLEALPEILQPVESLQHLYLSDCYNLKALPNNISHLKSLEFLYLSSCYNLKALPNNISHLKSLANLGLSSCYNLKALPNNISHLKSLERLDLSDCYNLKALPNNISHLKSLIELEIRNCKLIRFIPTLPQSLCLLFADNCESLETLSVRSNCKIEQMNFSNCYKLDEKSRRKIIALARIQLENIEGRSIILPGTEIPQWFLHRSVGSSLTVPLPSNSNHLVGLSSCIVFQNSPNLGSNGLVRLKFKCYDEFNTGTIFDDKMLGASLYSMKSDHLLLGKFPSYFDPKELLRTCTKALIELCLDCDLDPNHLVKQFGLDFHFGEEYSYSDSEEYSISTEEDCQKLMGEDAHSKGGCDNYCPIDVEISKRTRATDEEEDEKPPPTKN